MTRMANFTRISTLHTHGDTYEVVSFELKDLTDEMKSLGWTETQYGTIDHRLIHNGQIQANVSLGELCHGNTIAEALEDRERRYECAKLLEKLKAEGII